MTTFKAAPAWTRPEYVGSGSCTVPEGVDPESLAPDGAVMRYSGSPGYIAWRTPETWVRVVTDHQSILDWMPPSATALTPPRAKGDVFDHRWVCIIDWPGLDAWRAQQAQAAPKPVDMGPVVLALGARSFTAHGWYSDDDGATRERVENVARKLRASHLRHGGEYKILGVDAAEPMLGGWLCVRDYTGPDYVAPNPVRVSSAVVGPVVDPPYPPNAMRTEDTMARYQCSRPVCTPGRDGMATSEHTAGPDIIPAAVLARRATGYHRGRVSMPTDLDDGLIPDAEPEGIVPRGAR